MSRVHVASSASESVAVYSTADAESAVVRFADEAVQIGPPATGRSYLHIPSLIGAAKKTGADALHPGYGFLSEDPYFAEICASEGIAFIGPRPEVMERVGDKATARDLMQKAGLPLLPGTVDPVNTVDEAREIADGIGYPVIIKAVAGGGGRGMNVVYSESRAADALPDRLARRRRRCSRTRPSTSSATSRRRTTPRCSSSATRTATASTSGSATARCSGATRS